MHKSLYFWLSKRRNSNSRTQANRENDYYVWTNTRFFNDNLFKVKPIVHNQETRVAWINVPDGTTVQQVQAKIESKS